MGRPRPVPAEHNWRLGLVRGLFPREVTQKILKLVPAGNQHPPPTLKSTALANKQQVKAHDDTA